jgi:hypothetical protein
MVLPQHKVELRHGLQPQSFRQPFRHVAEWSLAKRSAYERHFVGFCVSCRPHGFHCFAPRTGKTSVCAPGARRAVFYKRLSRSDLSLVSRRERADGFHAGVPVEIMKSIGRKRDSQVAERSAIHPGYRGTTSRAACRGGWATISLSFGRTAPASPGHARQKRGEQIACWPWPARRPGRRRRSAKRREVRGSRVSAGAAFHFVPPPAPPAPSAAAPPWARS